jgi:hypothetical protein
MRKIIYTAIILAVFQFAQAQQVTGLYFDNNGTPISLEGGTLTIPSGITGDELPLPLIIDVVNDGTRAINTGDTLYLRLVLNEETPDIIGYVFPETAEINVGFSLGYDMPVIISHLKAGTLANQLCADVMSISYSGVPVVISKTPYCASMTITGGRVGISDVNNLQEVHIFPLPARDNLKIENINETTDIHIYNLTGQLIQSVPSVIGSANIDVSNLSNGLYVLKMQSGKNIRTEKIQIIE